jgi:hypothetical protein
LCIPNGQGALYFDQFVVEEVELSKESFLRCRRGGGVLLARGRPDRGVRRGWLCRGRRLWIV